MAANRTGALKEDKTSLQARIFDLCRASSSSLYGFSWTKMGLVGEAGTAGSSVLLTVLCVVIGLLESGFLLAWTVEASTWQRKERLKQYKSNYYQVEWKFG